MSAKRRNQVLRALIGARENAALRLAEGKAHEAAGRTEMAALCFQRYRSWCSKLTAARLKYRDVFGRDYDEL